jgi:hypothetical protein
MLSIIVLARCRVAGRKVYTSSGAKKACNVRPASRYSNTSPRATRWHCKARRNAAGRYTPNE